MNIIALARALSPYLHALLDELHFPMTIACSEHQTNRYRRETGYNQQLAPIPEIYHRERRKWIRTIPGHENHPQ